LVRNCLQSCVTLSTLSWNILNIFQHVRVLLTRTLSISLKNINKIIQLRTLKIKEKIQVVKILIKKCVYFYTLLKLFGSCMRFIII
jgi:hypothetical protein